MPPWSSLSTSGGFVGIPMTENKNIQRCYLDEADAFLPFKWFNPFSEITKAIILIAVRVYMQGEAFPSAPGRLVRCLRDIQCPVTEGHFCGRRLGPHAPHLRLFIVMETGVGYTQYGEQGSDPAQNVP